MSPGILSRTPKEAQFSHISIGPGRQCGYQPVRYDSMGQPGLYRRVSAAPVSGTRGPPVSHALSRGRKDSTPMLTPSLTRYMLRSPK